VLRWNQPHRSRQNRLTLSPIWQVARRSAAQLSRADRRSRSPRSPVPGWFRSLVHHRATGLYCTVAITEGVHL